MFLKFVTEEQLAAHAAASRRGALEGTGIGAAIAATGGFVLQRRSPAFRALPPSLKALGAVICIAPTLAIFAERRGVQYDKSQWYVYIHLHPFIPGILTSIIEGR